jgi:tetratricopeptide (TPR) repeat protein
MLKADILLHPRKWDTHFALGEAYQMQQKNDAAIPEFETAVAITPWAQDPYIYLADLLDDAKRYDEALKYAKMDLTLNPKDGAVVDTAADVYLRKKKWDLSERLARYASGIDDTDMVAHENLGEALIQEGKKDEATAEWHKVVDSGDERMAPVAKKMLSQYP